MIPAPAADLCLGYANTRYWRGTATPTEEFNSPDDLLGWIRQQERLPPELLRQPDRRTFDAAIALRETIHRCFAATAAGRDPDASDLDALNAALQSAPPRRRVRPGGWDVGAPKPSTS